MELQFIGAAGTVTGSKYLLTLNEKYYLIDCGLFQGLKNLRLRNWNPFPVDPKKIEAVILTHAHIDHTGYLPVLVKNGFRGKIYSTAATHALCEILLPDSGYLQEEDAGFANKHQFSKHHPALPLYTEKEAKNCLSFFKTADWRTKISLGNELVFEFLEAGHILGAAMIRLKANGRTMIFSGDLGRPNGITMPPPAKINETDYLILESTYGNKNHPNENPKEELKKIIEETTSKGGTVLIPSFAVGRAQQILFLINQLKKEGALKNIPVYVNSPMALDATHIFCQFDKEQSLSVKECQEMFATAQFVTTVEESKSLNSLKKPAVIISASGMATGGRVLHHLKYLAPDPKNTILFSGFQAPGTRGEAMIHGAEEIRIHGMETPVRAKVKMIETLSAHADQGEILGWLENFDRKPNKTFLTHGEPLAREALRKMIESRLGWSCEVPDYLEKFPLL